MSILACSAQKSNGWLDKLHDGPRKDENVRVNGYLHPGYVESLAEFGTPRELPRCGGWILERQIPGFSDHDAMGCYPLFCCQDWSQLSTDLEDLADELVSLSVVTDPFGEYEPACLQRCFKDVVVPFKKHYVADLRLPLNSIGGRRHRKHGRRALRRVEVEVCPEPTQFIEEWVALYDTLVERHNISGIPAFSRAAFAKQLAIPGMAVVSRYNIHRRMAEVVNRIILKPFA